MLKLLEKIFPYAVVILIIIAIVYILLLPFLAAWKLFKKVGIPGWKSLIPFYNTYLVFKITGMPGLCFIPTSALSLITSIYTDTTKMPDWLQYTTLVLMVIVVVINIIRGIKLGKVFGKGTIFMIGLILLPELFEIILGMGKAKYNGPYKVKEKKLKEKDAK
jgi:fumarate reductase subunit C